MSHFDHRILALRLGASGAKRPSIARWCESRLIAGIWLNVVSVALLHIGLAAAPVLVSIAFACSSDLSRC